MDTAATNICTCICILKWMHTHFLSLSLTHTRFFISFSFSHSHIIDVRSDRKVFPSRHREEQFISLSGGSGSAVIKCLQTFIILCSLWMVVHQVEVCQQDQQLVG